MNTQACRIITASYAFLNTAASSASLAEALTFVMIVYNMCTTPLIGGISSRFSPR